MTAAKEDGQIRLEPGRIARIVIDAPASRNAMTAAMWGALPEIAARVGADPATRVVVLTGAGGTFCAGADIGEFAETCATPERAAMAEFMAMRAEGTSRPAQSDAPEALEPVAAFREPLPSLERPSLDAARRLLASGAQIEGFVQNLLENPEP